MRIVMGRNGRIERDDGLVPDPIPEEVVGPVGDAAPVEDAGETRPPTRREAHARTEPVGSRRSMRMRGAARLLAFAGALLFAVAAWLPWALVTGTDATAPLAAPVHFPLDPGSIGAPPLPSFYHLDAAFVVWSTISILGILLAALLWLGAGRLAAFLTWFGYTTWLLVTSYTSVRSAMALLGAGGHSLRLAPGAGPASVAVHGVGLGVGVPLAALALLLGWVGGILVLLAGARGLGHARVFAPVVGVPQSVSRWLLLAGLAGWAVGFLEIPWVSADCADPILGVGSCSGVRATDLLGSVIGSSFSASLLAGGSGLFVGIDPRIALYAIPTVLLGAALLLAGAFARRAGAPLVYVWAALWLLTASSVAIVARSGAEQMVSGARAPGLPAGVWQGAAGIYVTLASLVLVLAGLALHWLAPLFPRGQAPQVA